MINSIVFIISSLCFFLVALRSILKWTFFWQSQDYQITRSLFAKSFISKSSLFTIRSLFVIAFFSYGLVITNDSFLPWFYGIVSIMLLINAVSFIREVIQRVVLKPLFTFRALTIALLTLFSISLLYMIPLFDTYFWFLILLFLCPIFITIFIGLFAFPAEIYIDLLLQRAQKKIGKNKKLTIILFYGDENEKITLHYVSRILGKSFFVVSIDEMSNLEIAKAIIRKIESKTEIVLYKLPTCNKENMQKIFSLLPPNIGVFTGEKLKKGLFPDFIQETFEGKYLLVNGDAVALSSAQFPEKHIGVYGIESKRKKIIYASKIFVKRKMTYFQVQMGKEKYTFTAPVTDITNVLPGIFIARAFGMSITTIQQALRFLTPIK